MSEAVFNLDRKINMQENIDPQGKKWEIKKQNKSGSLYVAVPNPYRADFVCPKPFSGAWTLPSTLQEKITSWLNTQWDKAEKAQQRAGIVAHQAALVEKQAKITPTESLEALAPEVKAMIEDMADGKDEETEVGRETETDSIEGGSTAEESTSSPEEKEESKEEGQVDATKEASKEERKSTPKKKTQAKKKTVAK